MALEVFVCEECGTEISPLCNMKRHEGKTYCIPCYQRTRYPQLMEKWRKMKNDIQ